MASKLIDHRRVGRNSFSSCPVPARGAWADTSDASAKVAGAGAPYQFTIGAGMAVTGCKDKGGAVVNLMDCLNAAAYSSYFKFTTDRVIGK